MSSEHSGPLPTEIKLHQSSRTLSITFDDNKRFNLTCEYLRVFSPSAEVRTASDQGVTISGKETVNITSIEPMGNYAVRLTFDDGHDSGVFPWELLYELGTNQAANWQSYLDGLEKAGVARNPLPDEPEEKTLTVNVLYFAWIAEKLGRESEPVLLPRGKKDVASLLAQLRKRGDIWERGFDEKNVNITVNKQFASPNTALHENDEVGIVPTVPW